MVRTRAIVLMGLVSLVLAACGRAPDNPSQISVDDARAALDEKNNFTTTAMERPDLPEDSDDSPPEPKSIMDSVDQEALAEFLQNLKNGNDQATPPSPAAPPKPAPPKASAGQPATSSSRPIALWDIKKDLGAKWTQATLQAIDGVGKELLTTPLRDISQFCPAYNTLDQAGRKAFWVFLMSAIAVRESDFNPMTSYTEAFTDSSKTRVVSRGLLQISFESSRYYGCGIKQAADLYKSEKNLACGIKIMNQWISDDQVLSARSDKGWLGGARYWAVLRKPRIKNWIIGQTRLLPTCATSSKK